MKLEEHVGLVVERSKAFYAAKSPGHFLVHAEFPTEGAKTPPLSSYDLDRQLTEYLDQRLKVAMLRWRAREGLDDDSIPCICPTFGVAEHSAWLGMDVHLQERTCLPVPMVHGPADLDKIRMSETDRWFGYMKKGYDYLRSRKDGTFFLSNRGTMSPMEIANAVRGDEIFTDFLLEPEFCHKLLDRLVPALRWFYGKIWEWSDDIAGGRAFNYSSQWMPAGTIGHLSNDAAMLCSPEVYHEFGFPYEKRQIEGFKHVFYHIHNERMHFIPEVAKLPGMALLEVSHDPKTPAPVEDWDRVLGATGNANLLIHASSDQVRKNIEHWKTRNVLFHVYCKDRPDAEDITRFVRSESKK